jgi:hypothetical protein
MRQVSRAPNRRIKPDRWRVGSIRMLCDLTGLRPSISLWQSLHSEQPVCDAPADHWALKSKKLLSVYSKPKVHAPPSQFRGVMCQYNTSNRSTFAVRDQ